MKTKHATLSLEELVTVTGGAALPWSAIGNAVRRLLPGPTMPLGPYIPPRQDGGKIA